MLIHNLVNNFLLVICFLLLFCGSGKKIQFSRKYIPVYNPGGRYFFYDQKFSKSYELYRKRHDALKEKGTLDTLKRDKESNQYNELNARLADSSEFTDGDNAMINSYGIDLTRLKGAKFIEVIDESSSYEYNQKNKVRKTPFAVFLQRVKAVFERVSCDIGSKMRDLHKRKSISGHDAMVDFDSYSEVKCNCKVPNLLQEEGLK